MHVGVRHFHGIAGHTSVQNVTEMFLHTETHEVFAGDDSHHLVVDIDHSEMTQPQRAEYNVSAM